jgi:hypothetical protein
MLVVVMTQANWQKGERKMKMLFDFARSGARSRTLRIGYSLSVVVIVLGMVMALTSVVFAKGDSPSNLIAMVRAATTRFHNLATAQATGYATFLGCIDQPGQGAMGFHYVNGNLITNLAPDPLHPQALLYESDDGKVQLTWVEYVIFAGPWTSAGHTQPPSLFGQTFNYTGFPNRFGLPPFYSLHAWVWKSNPSGMFATWNPKVTCTADN